MTQRPLTKFSLKELHWLARKAPPRIDRRICSDGLTMDLTQYTHERKMMDLNDFLGRSGSVDLAEPSLAPTDEDASSQEDIDLSTFSPVSESTDTRQEASRYNHILVRSFQTVDSEPQEESNLEEQSQSSFQSDNFLKEYQEKSLDHPKAEEVRSVFADPTMWRCLNHFQIECFGAGDCFDTSLPSMRVHREDPWLWFQREDENGKENDVVMKVEVSMMNWVVGP